MSILDNSPDQPTDMFGRPIDLSGMMSMRDPMPKRKPWQVSMPSSYRGPGGPAMPPMPDPRLVGSAMPEPGGKVKGPSIWEKMQDRLMPVPAGMEGLLSPEEIKSARTQGMLGMGASLLGAGGPVTADKYQTTGQALGQAIQGGQGALQAPLTNKMNVMQLQAAKAGLEAKQDELAKAKKLTGTRQAIISKYPPPTDDPAKMGAWIDQVLPHFIEAGDSETVNQLTDLRKSVVPKGDRYQQAQTGDLVTSYDSQTGKLWDPTAEGGKGGWVTSIERHMLPDQLALKQSAAELAAARLQASEATANSGKMERLSKTWVSGTKAMTDRVTPINQALMALDAARTEPVVGANAIIAFMSAVDPKAQQRYQMVNWVSSHLTPALAEQAKRMLDSKTTGLMPPELLDAMEAHVKRTRDRIVAQEGRQYDEFIKLHPEMRDQLTRVGTSFDPDNPAGPARTPLSELWKQMHK